MTSLIASSYPPMVQGLHAAFFSYLRMDMPASPYLEPSSRVELENLLDRGAPAREIADELLFSTITGWSCLPEQRVAGVKVDSKYGIEALFAPMEKGDIIFGAGDIPEAGRKAEAEPIARGIAHHHPSANRYLEIRYPSGTPGLETYFTVHAEMNIYGLYLFAMQDDDVVLRIPSLSFFESTLKYCLGKRALTPCFANGEVEPSAINLFHKVGFHALGQPLRRLRMHGRTAEPADYTLHDLGHLIRASIHLTLFEQRASTLLHESGLGLLKGDPRFRQIWALLSEDFAHLMNLEVGPVDGSTLSEILIKVRGLVLAMYGQEAVNKFFAQYENRVARFFKTEEKRDDSLRQELQAFRLRLNGIRTGQIT